MNNGERQGGEHVTLREHADLERRVIVLEKDLEQIKRISIRNEEQLTLTDRDGTIAHRIAGIDKRVETLEKIGNDALRIARSLLWAVRLVVGAILIGAGAWFFSFMQARF